MLRLPYEFKKANKTALGNPLSAPSRSLRVATNLNLKRRGAPGSGCQASTLAKEIKNILTFGLLFSILLYPVLSAQDAVIRGDDPFLPKVTDSALRLEEDKKAQVEIPKEFLGIEGTNIQIVAKNGQSITYRLNNNTDNPISFGCSGINNPSTAIEVLKDGRWQPPENFMICGTGLYLATLAPKKSILFKAKIWDSGTQMKVGIQIMAPADAKGDRTAVTVWSPPTKEGEQAAPSNGG